MSVVLETPEQEAEELQVLLGSLPWARWRVQGRCSEAIVLLSDESSALRDVLDLHMGLVNPWSILVFESAEWSALGDDSSQIDEMIERDATALITDIDGEVLHVMLPSRLGIKDDVLEAIRKQTMALGYEILDGP